MVPNTMGGFVFVGGIWVNASGTRLTSLDPTHRYRSTNTNPTNQRKRGPCRSSTPLSLNVGGIWVNASGTRLTSLDPTHRYRSTNTNPTNQRKRGPCRSSTPLSLNVIRRLANDFQSQGRGGIWVNASGTRLTSLDPTHRYRSTNTNPTNQRKRGPCRSSTPLSLNVIRRLANDFQSQGRNHFTVDRQLISLGRFSCATLQVVNTDI